MTRQEGADQQSIAAFVDDTSVTTNTQTSVKSGREFNDDGQKQTLKRRN